MQQPRSTSIIVDLYGAYLREVGGWIAINDLIALLADLGTEEQAVRSTVSRMSRKGLLKRQRQDGVAGYVLSGEAEQILEEGDQRIFAGRQRARLDEGWVLAMFSIPERHRSRRHQLRVRLTALGFGSLGGGVWIAPARIEPRATEALQSLGLEQYVDMFTAHYRGFSEQAELVARAWDLPAIAERYEEYIQAAQPVLAGWHNGASDEKQAFVDYTQLLHAWRKLPYLDPGLPLDLLPENWPGERAAELFEALRKQLEEPATRYVAAVVQDPLA